MIDDALTELASRLGEALLRRRIRVVTAESCTGGLIAATLTEIPGSSLWFDAGFVVYSNACKTRFLEVPEDLINRHGAVSGPVVEAMARGALRHSDAEWAIAVSGIAGPGGGSVEKPVGTVWINWTSRAGQVLTRHHHWPGERGQVRREAVKAALATLIDLMGS